MQVCFKARSGMRELRGSVDGSSHAQLQLIQSSRGEGWWPEWAFALTCASCPHLCIMPSHYALTHHILPSLMHRYALTAYLSPNKAPALPRFSSCPFLSTARWNLHGQRGVAVGVLPGHSYAHHTSKRNLAHTVVVIYNTYMHTRTHMAAGTAQVCRTASPTSH